VPPLEAYYEEYFGPKTNALGFGPERGLGWPLDAFPGHSPGEAVLNAALNTFSLNIELFGWGCGSLVLVALLVFGGGVFGRDYLMMAVIVTTAVLYSFYWFHGGPDFGARYWYLMLVPLVVLTVRGAEYLERKIDAQPGGAAGREAVVLVGLLALCLGTVLNYVPWRAIDKYHHYLGMRPDIHKLAAERGFGRSLVLVRGESYPDYASAWVHNPLDLTADEPIYAWDVSPDVRARVLHAYADRPVWVVNGPSVTDGTYEVVAGPLLGNTYAVTSTRQPLPPTEPSRFPTAQRGP
jgi:hypothetical protein